MDNGSDIWSVTTRDANSGLYNSVINPHMVHGMAEDPAGLLLVVVILVIIMTAL